MNNIINIRMGHYVLAADEDAANLLRTYSTALKNRYRNEEGADEIVQDIEERIGELLQQKQKENNRSFTILADAEAVLQQMGPVENDESPKTEASSAAPNNNESSRRRLFRDTESRILGGVCAGFGNYFDIDPVIIRIIWFITVFFFGFGVPLYIVLWVIIPEAKTTAEKLMMKGQTPNLQNIEDNVKAEFRRVENAFREKGGMGRFSHFIQTLVMLFGKALYAIVKAALSVGVGIMIAVFIATIIAFTTKAFHIHTRYLSIDGQEGLNTILTAFGDPYLLKAGVLAFLLFSIAFAVLLVLMPRNMRTQLKTARTYIGWGLVTLFFILLGTFIYGILGISHRAEKMGPAVAFKTTGDTLYLETEGLSPDGKGFYACNRLFDLATSEDSNFHIEQTNHAWGESYRDAQEKARKLPQMFKVQGNKLWLTECTKIKSLNDANTGYASFTLYIPKGKHIKTGNRMFNDHHYPNWLESNQVYSMDSGGLAMPLSSNGESMQIDAKLSELDIDGRFDVQLIYSNLNKIELVSGPIRNHRDWISNNGHTLEIDGDEDDILNDDVSVIRIYSNAVRNIRNSGVSEIWLRNYRAGDMQIECEGASHIRGNLVADRLKLDVSGASGVQLQGSADFAEIEVDGASSYTGGAFHIKDGDFNLDGASSAAVWVTGSLKADCSGASKLKTKVKPAYSNIHNHGMSSTENWD